MGVFGEMVLLVPARGMGPELFLREVTHRVADHFLVLGQQHGIGAGLIKFIRKQALSLIPIGVIATIMIAIQ